MTLDVIATSQFRRDYELLKRRGYDIGRLNDVIVRLSNEEQLPPRFKDHRLKGNLREYRECHITYDWILIYKIDRNALVLLLSRTGEHDDLF